MYKVFVNDKPLILTTSVKKQHNYPVYMFAAVSVDAIIHKLANTSISGLYLFSNALDKDWVVFREKIAPVIAGGGLVLNEKEEILFIYRGGKWDLPKGRTEIGENIEQTAIREVEEECGIQNLTLKNFLTITYHVYFQDGQYKLKETHWFLMFSNYKGALSPQTEEGITQVSFKNSTQIKALLPNTYANIRLVYENYQKLAEK
ncbi:NUDIX hydrolase [Tenacibaculum sp. SG-28]|uniref:NUDIX hydrolase n=1 Tax=Tenacibaculum sp. SG-28 TaxID=754426 RepID=UPI000CF518FA|nr:NUDIX domain-containing protein [Tenacibaculum sp. SG-28]PQJ23536.1 NUDIX hydrolase [Tenacibaculum sp. SG-28]